MPSNKDTEKPWDTEDIDKYKVSIMCHAVDDSLS